MTSNNRTASNLALLIIPFLAAFIFGPLHQLNWLSMMPGDLGDARLNNYFLENIYQYLRGNSLSLIHLNFFSPFPYVLGFSDNLFGASPIYLLARIITGESDTAYQLWFLIGYIVNYLAAYYALKLLKMSHVSAIFGALVFTFALPVVAQMGHAQLQYRFGVPLATAYFLMFLEGKNWRNFTVAMAWLTWQFYCTIYIGTFELLFLVAMAITYISHKKLHSEVAINDILKDFKVAWRSMDDREKIKQTLITFTLIVLMGILFYPYIKVSMLYGFKHSLGEIAIMLPRPMSYFLADGSRLWSSNSSLFFDIPMRHEQQMFVGLLPILLAVTAFLIKSKNYKYLLAFEVISWALVFLILLTLCFGNFVSLWVLFYKLPLINAIRAFSRIILVFLFPIAFLCAISIERIQHQNIWHHKKIIVLLMLGMVFEFISVDAYVSPKLYWRERFVNEEKRLPTFIPKNSILFFAPKPEDPLYLSDIDAMLVSQKHGISTLNGYSGHSPLHYEYDIGDDCSSMPVRLLSYFKFIGKQGGNEYQGLLKRVIPIGFEGCNPDWYTTAPKKSSRDHLYSVSTFKKISIQYINKKEFKSYWLVSLRLKNDSNEAIQADSSVDKNVRLSWRFVAKDGQPKSGWDARQDLPFDVNSNASINIAVPIDKKLIFQDGYIEFSLVQEHVFWAFNVGVASTRVMW